MTKAGRKPMSKTGELMKPRQIRMTEQEWADARLVGTTAIRAFVTKQAAKIKRAPALPDPERLK
jgi:hypothetical protein